MNILNLNEIMKMLKTKHELKGVDQKNLKNRDHKKGTFRSFKKDHFTKDIFF